MYRTYCKASRSLNPPYADKTNESRDRLRTLLNQRKEEVNEGLNMGSALDIKLNSKSNSSNCTTGASEIAIINGKSVNVSRTNAKVNAKPVTNDAENRVSEVVHPVPPPTNTKPTLASAETKKMTNITNGQVPFSSIQRVPVGRSFQVCSAERNVNECQPARSSSLNSDNVDLRDINELLNYIEGSKAADKAALAKKKAAKKATRRIKKAQQRERAKKAKQLKKEASIREGKRKEEERLKAEVLARQVAEKPKKNWKIQKLQPNQKAKKNSKKKCKSGNENSSAKESEKKSNLIEETIPAMVTIKRVAEGNKVVAASVAITLKGATPETDKLLFTLVNGHNNKKHVATATINRDPEANKAKTGSTIKTQSENVASTTDHDKNLNKKKKKVTIAVNKNSVANKKDASGNKKNTKSSNSSSSKVPEPKAVKNMKETSKISQSKPSDCSKDDINLRMLRLLPGITITKIEGPPTSRNCKASSQNNQSSNAPVSKSGAIVFDTEKLIQQSIAANNNKKNKKKNKKKRAQKAETPETDGAFTDKTGSSMVTLKNPVFYTLQTALCNKVNSDIVPVFQNNHQASIFNNKNGMVTIRSPRLQNPFENGSSTSTSFSYVPMCHSNFFKSSKKSSFNVQEILSGLPGIEITKIDKADSKGESENKKVPQPAEVAIIPTNNGGSSAHKFNIDKDDWPFESVFTPRDVLEEDMDPEERELEAFKRFCQQSVPPKHKVKIAHLNVKDIIFKLKKDVTYS